MPQAAILANWPIVAATVTACGAIIAVIRYRIPDLAKKVEAMEQSQHPTDKDLQHLVSSMRTICNFNQVTCQKGMNCHMAKVREEIDEKLSALTDLINKQAIIIARVDERVASMCFNPEHRPLISPKRVITDE